MSDEQLPEQPSVTWEVITTQADKVNSMVMQTVEQAALLGQMLVDIHPTCANQKEFVQRVRQATGYKKAHAFNLMNIARHWPELAPQKPISLRHALRLLEPPKPKPESKPESLPEPESQPQPLPEPEGDDEMSGSWADIAYKFGLIKINGWPTVLKAKAEIEELRPGACKRNDENELASVCRIIAARRKGISLEELDKLLKREAAEELSKSKRTAFERHLAQQIEVLREDFRLQLHEEFERTLPDRMAELKKREEKALREKKQYQIMRNGITSQLTPEDYRFLLGAFHPDRAPAGWEEKFSRAFQIVRKFDEYVKAQE